MLWFVLLHCLLHGPAELIGPVVELLPLLVNLNHA